MYLKRIDILGFKSFTEKTKIPFEMGISCIVGPNGSGKIKYWPMRCAGFWESRALTLCAEVNSKILFFPVLKKENLSVWRK